jgi:hypothetical protein
MSSSTNTPESELASIRQELNELRQTVGAMRGNGHYNGNGTSFLESAESTALTDRRGMMKKMAGLAVGVAAVGLLKPMTAKAASRKYYPDVTGGNMIIGGTNAPTNPPDSTLLENPGSVLWPLLFFADNFNNTSFVVPANSFISVAGHVNDAGTTPANGNLYGVYGEAVTGGTGTATGVFGTGTTHGVFGSSASIGVGGSGPIGGRFTGSGSGCGVDGINDGATPAAYGVRGTAAVGYGGNFNGGTAAIGLNPGAGAVPNPNIGGPAGFEGDLYRGSTNGSLWYRTNAAASAYRRVGDATTAGALTLLATPVRYVDTRISGGAFVMGEVRSYNFVTLNAGTIPAGATGIVGNIVAVSPNTTGNLQINTANSFPAGSAAVLNFNPGQDIANHFVSALSAASLMFVRANPNGGSVQLVIDIYGYYL